jgi:hypothetical protein
MRKYASWLAVAAAWVAAIGAGLWTSTAPVRAAPCNVCLICEYFKQAYLVLGGGSTDTVAWTATGTKTFTAQAQNGPKCPNNYAALYIQAACSGTKCKAPGTATLDVYRYSTAPTPNCTPPIPPAATYALEMTGGVLQPNRYAFVTQYLCNGNVP